MASTVTEFCGAGIVWCESCSAMDRPLEVALRTTATGQAVCLVLCPVCTTHAPAVYSRASAEHFAAEHRTHLTRAADVADPRRGSS